MKNHLAQLKEFGNLSAHVAAIRFGLGWILLLAGLAWLFPLWTNFRGTDEFLLGSLGLCASLIARYSPRWISPGWGLLLLCASAAAIYLSALSYSPAPNKLFVLGCAVAALSMILRAASFVVSRLQLWSLAPIFFWGILLGIWGDFYADDLSRSKFRIVLWIIPIVALGFVLLRLLAERIGELWLWLFVALSAVSIAALDPLEFLRRIESMDTDLLYVQLSSLVHWLLLIGALSLSLLWMTRPKVMRKPFYLLRTLHCGALFGLAPVFVFMGWRSTWWGCCGMSLAFADALIFTGFFVFALGPMMLEKADWCGEVRGEA